MDFEKMDYETYCTFTDEEIIEAYEDMTGFEIYYISYAWRDSREYILKMKGTKGDIIINWR